MEKHGLCRIDVDVDITGGGVTFSLVQMHKRYDLNWPEKGYQYAPLQFYLARLS